MALLNIKVVLKNIPAAKPRSIKRSIVSLNLYLRPREGLEAGLDLAGRFEGRPILGGLLTGGLTDGGLCPGGRTFGGLLTGGLYPGRWST